MITKEIKVGEDTYSFKTVMTMQDRIGIMKLYEGNSDVANIGIQMEFVCHAFSILCVSINDVPKKKDELLQHILNLEDQDVFVQLSDHVATFFIEMQESQKKKKNMNMTG